MVRKVRILALGVILACCSLSAPAAYASTPAVGPAANPLRAPAPPASWGGFAPKDVQPAAVCSNPYVLYNKHSGKVLEVYHSQTNDGANVDQWTANGTPTQQWCTYLIDHWQNNPNFPIYEVVNNNSGKCLDLTNGNTTNGANIQQWACLGDPQQQWVVTVVNNSYQFWPLTVANTNLGLSYLMEVYNWGTANGDNVDLWRSMDDANQEWCPGPCP